MFSIENCTPRYSTKNCESGCIKNLIKTVDNATYVNNYPYYSFDIICISLFRIIMTLGCGNLWRIEQINYFLLWLWLLIYLLILHSKITVCSVQLWHTFVCIFSTFFIMLVFSSEMYPSNLWKLLIFYVHVCRIVYYM